MRTIRLMADYQCWPLWDEDGNVDPADLPLSDALRRRLVAWAQAFEAGFDWDDPAASPPMSPQAEAAFVAERERLGADLQAELGEAWRVTVHSP
ncbi:MAG: hypothetical protein EON95_01730 [Caulobacteraceae bacterium]|nr:MAG: hypothetical protein EON95_01730 [Caulobacteraceae bacterium]